jgi:uncharacterized protein YbaR (Trm112 family)
MRHDLMEIICCPVCKSDLDLIVQEENEVEILSGSLTCKKCEHTYSIEDGIPNLLPPDL